VDFKAEKRSFARRLKLNRSILGNQYWVLPVDDEGFEDFMPVGRGVPSNEWCGKHRGLLVCQNVEAHKGVMFKGSDCTNKVFVRNQHFWCKKSSCPVCFVSGWSVRGAKVVEARLDKAVERGFGDVEHIIVSVPKSDYGLFYKDFRHTSLKVLRRLRVLGGCMIFHGFRINRSRKVLFWSPHFHVLGFVRGGYKCRECERKWNCLKGCGGFDDRSFRSFQKNHYFVKVMYEERKTVFGTAFYQLNHATVKLGIGRFHVITWFGNCGCRKFNHVSVKTSLFVPCKLCGEDMNRGFHSGKRAIVKHLGDAGYKSSFVDDELDEDGLPNYVE